MQTLLQNKEKYFILKDKINGKDKTLFKHTLIHNYEINDSTLSIIMTSSNRSKQTYHTLKTIQNSLYKNIQLIIVDDSTYDPIQIEILESYPFYIDLIEINREYKDWHNPLVNYNIGFNFVKGNYVIIQNAEVSHVGDVINFIVRNIQDNLYFVFDIKAINSLESNEIIYKLDNIDANIYLRNELFLEWYQHKSINRLFHFLTGMTRKTFNLIDGFSYDYSHGSCYDDNDFILKIYSKGIKIINIFNEENALGGIHLYHINAFVAWDKNIEMNNELFFTKQRIFNQTGYYIDVTNNLENFDEEYKKLLI